MRWRVKIVVGTVSALALVAALGIVAASRRWWLAALGVDSLNRCYPAENAASGMSRGGQQQPRNGIAVR